jgi:hypothetical protein
MGDSCKFIFIDFSHSVIPTIRIVEVVRLSDADVIIHDPLRMRDINLTSPNPASPNPS